MLLNQKSAEQEISLKVREDFLLLPKTAELTRWVMAQSTGERTLPYFDPLDGGVFARVLILLESPLERSVFHGMSQETIRGLHNAT